MRSSLYIKICIFLLLL